MTITSRILCALFTMCALTIYSIEAHAHGGAVELKDDQCAKWAGRDVVHFNAYQPQHDKRANYCNNIPNTGETIVVVDLVNQKLRQTEVGVKVVQRKEGGVENAILELPPKVYTKGVIEMPMVFEHAGYYQALVTIAGSSEKQPVMNYRVALGQQVAAPGMQFMFAALVILALGILMAIMFGPIFMRMIGKS